MDFQTDCRGLYLKLPPGLPNDQYAAIAHAVFCVVEVAGLANRSSVVPDRLVSDADLNGAFDRHSESYPWGM